MGRLPGLKASLSERLVDWGLSRSPNKEAANILLSCWNTPGLLWRARFFLETAFPGSAYLRHYFGAAPGSLWPLLYFRTVSIDLLKDDAATLTGFGCCE